jgi:hypothetical protein
MRAPILLAAALLVLTGCDQGAGRPTGDPTNDPSRSADPPQPPDEPSPDPTSSRPTVEPPPEPPPEPGATPPPWLGTRVLPEGPDGYAEPRPTPPELRTRRFTLPDTLPPLPGRGFASRVDPVPDAVLRRSTWEPACPVAAQDLRWVRVTFWGFDDRRHTGELLLNERVADDLVGVFRALWQARFPLEELRITTRAELDAPPTGDGNNTGAFVCRPVTGGTSYSEHAYGLAVDVNPFQNPYVRDDLVLPELATAYLARGRRAPGMVRLGGPVVRAFAAIGWEWGGEYRSLKDWQHFSLTGG